MSTATAPASSNAPAAADDQARTNDRPSATFYAGAFTDPNSTVQAISQNWGWILAAGIISVLGGMVALMAPVLATGVTALFIAATLAVVGCFNLAGLCFADKGLKLETFLTGVVQVLLAGLMAFYPFASLMSITILIAGFLIADGIVRTVLAVKNRQVTGWGWTLASGLAGILMGVIVTVALPSSALWVIGILVGVSMLTNGAARIAIAMAGRSVANATD